MLWRGWIKRLISSVSTGADRRVLAAVRTRTPPGASWEEIREFTGYGHAQMIFSLTRLERQHLVRKLDGSVAPSGSELPRPARFVAIRPAEDR